MPLVCGRTLAVMDQHAAAERVRLEELQHEVACTPHCPHPCIAGLFSCSVARAKMPWTSNKFQSRIFQAGVMRSTPKRAQCLTVSASLQ